MVGCNKKKKIVKTIINNILLDFIKVFIGFFRHGSWLYTFYMVYLRQYDIVNYKNKH